MLATEIRTPSDLKSFVESHNEEPHFFTRNTMSFFGDTMRNYGLRQPVEVTRYDGSKVMAFELFRRRPVKHGLQGSAWFDATTFVRVFPANEIPE